MSTKQRIFISYSSKDQPCAEALYTDLLETGAEVFLYEQTSSPGGPVWDELFAWIESADVFIVLLSKSASESTRVYEEIEHAHYNYVNSRKPGKLIPAVLEQGVEIPRLLRRFSQLDFHDYAGGLQKLISELGLKLKTKSVEEADKTGTTPGEITVKKQKPSRKKTPVKDSSRKSKKTSREGPQVPTSKSTISSNEIKKIFAPFKYIHFHLEPQIEPKMMQNAKTHLSIPENEKIVALIEFGSFQKGKESLVFGTRGIYYNDGIASHPPGSVPYKRFPSCNFRRSGHGSVKLTPGQKFICSTRQAEEIIALLNAVKAFLTGSPGECPQCGLSDKWDGKVCGHCTTPTGIPVPSKNVTIPKEKLIEILEQINADGRVLDIYPDSSQKKIKNAIARFGIPSNEKIIATYDTNLLSKSMKDGMVFGINGIYFDRGIVKQAKGSNRLTYQQFPSCNFKIGKFSEVYLTKGTSIKYYSNIRAFLRGLNAIKEYVIQNFTSST